jgi:hypothetical protein
VGSAKFRHHMNELPSSAEQMMAVSDFFDEQLQSGTLLQYDLQDGEELTA